MKPQIIMTLALGLSLSACGLVPLVGEVGTPSPVERRGSWEIERGMSREQVLQILGRPVARSLGYNDEEIWEYRRREAYQPVRVILVTFLQGRVVKLENHLAEADRRPEAYPRYPNYPPSGGYPGYDPRYMPMSEEAFSRILRGIKGEIFEDDQMRMIRDIAQRNRFTTDQAARLMGIFYWAEEKLKVLRAVAPGLLDPQEAFRLVDLFTFDSDKQKARRILGYR